MDWRGYEGVFGDEDLRDEPRDCAASFRGPRGGCLREFWGPFPTAGDGVGAAAGLCCPRSLPYAPTETSRLAS